MNYSKYIDHTLLKADAVESQFDTLCEEAKSYDFKSVCVNPGRVAYCSKKLVESDVLVCTVIGFPLGATSTESKVFEAAQALKDGADEFDMVLNIGKLKEKNLEYVTMEIAAVKEAVGEKILKVIIETCLLTDEEKVLACDCVIQGHADFVKTSTGFSTGGATVDDVALLYRSVKGRALVKAAGGVRNRDDLKAMIDAGASRIGTSGGVKLMQGEKSEGNY